MDRVQSQVEELPENRVRLTVQVPSHDVHHAVEHAADDLAQSVKIPGFRKGKVPRQVLVQRVGRERLMTEAVESHIGGWFWNAAARSRVRPVAQPEYDFELPASEDQDWEFTATVAVQAKPELPDWKQLEVGVAEVEVPEELVAERARRAAGDGRRARSRRGPRRSVPRTRVVVDLVAEARRGATTSSISAAAPSWRRSSRASSGMNAGETKEISFELADGSTQSLSATVKEIKEKVLPPLDDDLARAATEFETFAELRADIESRLRDQIEDEIETRFRADAADALVAASKVEAAGPLVESRTRELLRGFARQVESRGVSVETFLAMTGQQPEELVARLQDEAAALGRARARARRGRRRARLEVPDAEVEELVREQAEALGDDTDEMLVALRENGRFESLREDLRLRKALDHVAGEVQRIPLAQAEAREAIWTPDKEKPPTETKLWTRPAAPRSAAHEGARS